MSGVASKSAASKGRAARVRRYLMGQGFRVDPAYRERGAWVLEVTFQGSMFMVDIKDSGYEHVRAIGLFPDNEMAGELYYAILRIK